jgi:hypothetical protein
MKLRILMVWVCGGLMTACSGAPGSSTGSSTVDGVKGSLGSASAGTRSHDGGRDESGDDEGQKRDASSCRSLDGAASPCARGDDDDDDNQGDMDNGDDDHRKDGGGREGGRMN